MLATRFRRAVSRDSGNERSRGSVRTVRERRRRGGRRQPLGDRVREGDDFSPLRRFRFVRLKRFTGKSPAPQVRENPRRKDWTIRPFWWRGACSTMVHALAPLQEGPSQSQG